jgi:hypothetical protein
MWGSGCIDPHILLTSALAGVEWSASHLGRFTPREAGSDTPLDRRLGGPQSRSGRRGKRKFLTLPGLELGP